ncbi:hypothetical protein ACTWP5_06780 [Streptomyces sp. 4N509B]|uniref:hypothetical protein n=1 Tax=Streptomyces sp. 4N509B TaxID=3457413 RepID=UPI003FD45B41
MEQDTSPLAAHVADWHPTPVTERDPLPPGPVAALSAVLDEPAPVAAAGEALPPLWHWLHFLHWPAQRDLGPDGHPSHGHFLPPLPHRRRMFAGGRCTVEAPLRLGEPAERTTELLNVTAKRGRSGDLLFVTQRATYRQRGRTCLVEEQDIVYRSGGGAPRVDPPAGDRSAAPTPPPPPAPPVRPEPPAPDGPWHRALRTDPSLLFRFSALTANAHRIHYDAPYAREAEGHPGLLVHGPLLALLMLELVRREAPERPVRSLAFRLRAPVVVGEHLLACGAPTTDGARAWIATHRQPRHATAEVVFG